MSIETQPNIMMIGPTRAGKTTLLQVLRLASMRRSQDGNRIAVEPINPEATRLFSEALHIIDTGNLAKAGTLGVSEYKIKLTCHVEMDVKVDRFVDEQAPGFWNVVQGKTVKVNKPVTEKRMVEREMSLTVLDGRGGDIFGTASNTKQLEDEPAHESKREALVELATQSEALIICLNACDPNTTKSFFRDLQLFLDEVKQRGKVIPFKRVAIVLTHADRQVEDFGSAAEAELAKRCPAQGATEAIGFYAKAGLFQSLPSATRSQVYAGWSSVYGFIHREGSVNFDPALNRVAIFDDNGKWTDNWYPLGIAEPFVFACTGKAVNMVRVTEN